ncbi:hypothetical protein AWU65_14430 [Paenibacillus glucanolyticus]|uniref:Carrier domain-containing protein n=1 Tax=Paenibacillus glucanolyticus TaxID=59843 RepID=A0A163K751_9BACL|nr:non-ribosomal peptide synthetase [Paenibacillus glucanolyticus]KZS47035.1 hypothetical protein AWU65_14430 [Paenibacillus glucanolyticus]
MSVMSFKRDQVEEIYSLSPMQEGLLFHYLKDTSSEAYFDQMILTVQGDIDVSVLEKSFNALLKKHPALRTIMLYDKVKKPMQIVLKEVESKINYVDLTKAIDIKAALQQFMSEDRKKGFDLTSDIMIRVSLLKISSDEYQIIISSHHILIDGWCMGIILNDLLDLYKTVLKGDSISYPKYGNYRTYIDWLLDQDLESGIKYWSDYLVEYDSLSQIPVNLEASKRNTGKSKKHYTHMIPVDLTNKLKNICNNHHVTMNNMFQTIWGILLQKYNNTNDVVFGSVVSGRPPHLNNVEQIVGLFINTVPVRIKSNNEESFVSLLKRIQEQELDSQNFNYLSLADIKAASNVTTDLFEHIIAYENFPVDLESIVGEDDTELGFKIVDMEALEENHYNFSMQIVEDTELIINVNYNPELYSTSLITSLFDHFNQILHSVVTNPYISISEIDIVSEEEKNIILQRALNLEVVYPFEQSIHQIFEEQAVNTPYKVAIVCDEETINYKDLNNKANHIAWMLKEKGIGDEDIVAILADRSIQMVISMLGVLKAGAAYLPVDSEYTEDRINFMLTDSCTKSIIVQRKEMYVPETLKNNMIILEEVSWEEAKANLNLVIPSSNLAYIIYTSGSTGKPKGVLIEHKNVASLLFHSNNQFDFNENDVWTVFHSFCFDFSVWELYGAILIGGTAVIIPSQISKDMKEFIGVLKQQRVTILNQTPSSFYQLIHEVESRDKKGELNCIRKVIFGGEALSPRKLATWVRKYPETQLVNMYGITEITVHATYKEITDVEISEGISNIGNPISTLSTYILNQSAQVVPVGVIGELYIGGAGVARGYINRSELTEERFIDDPFRKGNSMYKTGDLARWLPNGEIEYIGRIDDQVKIRGYRIEPGEIENVLLMHPNIDEVVVIAIAEQDESAYLCAYLVVTSNSSAKEYREYLKKYLPDYMVPTFFVELTKLPLTHNGKIDKKALPRPSDIVSVNSNTVPNNQVEQLLLDIWSDVLGTNKVGMDQSFFEIGGHSLKAMMLLSRIHKLFNIELSLKELFSNPTIHDLAKLVSNTNKSKIFNSIKISGQREFYPTTSTQKRFYFLQKMNKDSIAYNMPVIFEIDGALNINTLKVAFLKLLERHEILRTTFLLKEDELVQKVLTDVVLDFETHDLHENEQEVYIQNFIRPFNLDHAPLFRIEVLRVNDKKYILMIDMHHIISDNITTEVFLNELSLLYQGASLQPVGIQFKDYSVWQESQEYMDMISDQERYWLKHLSHNTPTLNLSTDTDRKKVTNSHGGHITFSLDDDLIVDLRKISYRYGTTIYMTLLSCYYILLSKYTGQDDIIIGSAITGRSHGDLDKVSGPLINTLAFRNKINNLERFTEFLSNVKESVLDGYENADYPFDQLIERLNIAREHNRSPLVETLFTLNYVQPNNEFFPEFKVSSLDSKTVNTKFDVSWDLEFIADSLFVTIEFNLQLYSKITIERMIKHFSSILQQIISNNDIQIKDIELVTTEEKRKIITEFNDTSTPYTSQTIHEMFEKQVANTPDHIAVVYEEQQLTYKEINARANQLARVIRSKGVVTDKFVGVMMKRSSEFIIGMLAVLKAGGAYVPLDPDYPAQRLSYMLADSGTRLLLTHSDLTIPENYAGEILEIDRMSFDGEDVSNLDVVNGSHDLAYLIYTSGSTGNPKGVMVDHDGVCNLSEIASKLQIDPHSRVLQVASMSFDASVWEIFLGLFHGATLYIVPKMIQHSGEQFAQWLDNHRITCIPFISPSLLRTLPSVQLPDLKTIVTAGEVLPVDLVEVWSHERIFINAYGPTETTVCATLAQCVSGMAKAPIGTPISNKKVYILNPALQVMPIGVPGELCVGGVGIARGYWQRPELTAEKFIDNPFEPGERLYRTGDLVRWLPDGSIEYVGRIDEQVKIRGNRVELGEIEAALLEHPKVKETVVITRQEEQDSAYLCAYLVTSASWSVGELRQHVGSTLPEYMIPSYFVEMEQLPLTPNGKVDKKGLPKPEGQLQTSAPYEAPATPTEEILVQIWQEVLGSERIGVLDNFFELGGHSLKAMMLVSRMHKGLDVEIPLREVFARKNIRELTEYIKQHGNERVYEDIAVAEEQPYYITSSAQRRMYVVQQLEGADTSYNMPAVYHVQGPLDEERWKQAVHALIERHEALRTSFELIDDALMQIIHPRVRINMDILDVGAEEAEQHIQQFVRLFDLSQAPLFRIQLLRLGAEEYLLLMDMHHIISDGMSWDILLRELGALYEGQTLEPLRIQYKDYAVWQQSREQKERLVRHKQYWLDQYEGELPVLELPTDYPRPPVQRFEGETYEFELDAQMLHGLKALAVQEGSTLYAVLLACYNILLAKYTGQEDIIVGTAIVGRPQMELEKIVGVFINTITFRNAPQAALSFRTFLTQVKDQVYASYEHAEYPFEELIEQLQLRRDMSRHPLVDTLFTLQNININEFSIPNTVITPKDESLKSSKFDLSWFLTEDNSLHISIEYSTHLFKRLSIERMAGHFKHIVSQVLFNSEIRILDMELATASETQQLLNDFNHTAKDYDEDKTIHQLFEEQVERTPNHIAIIFQDQKLTYEEVNTRANRLAWFLKKKGVTREQIVGIMMERSIDMMIGILAILKAGGAYLPILPSYPEERIKYMLKDSNVKIILNSNSVSGNGFESIETINIEQLNMNDESITNLPSINSSSDLVYLMYTSGSTGAPKGVMIEHRSVHNRLNWMIDEMKISSSDVILQKTPFVFDVSVWELFSWFLVGAHLVLLSPEGEKHPEVIIDSIYKAKVTLIHFVPSMLNVFLNELGSNTCFERISSVRKVFTSGEALLPKQVHRFNSVFSQNKNVDLHNLYGPTEGTVEVSHYKCIVNQQVKLVPIGKPIDNVRLYIFNRHGKVQPIGIPGELHIGGICLTRGYLNKEQLNKDKFIQNSYTGERLYKTGDVARWLQDGNIEYLGRLDDQVKIRGNRIEIGEIQVLLSAHPLINEAIVISRKDHDDEVYLCAYFVSSTNISTKDLRQYLLDKLPEFMVPSYFVPINNIPVNTNGKIDRKSLPEPTINIEMNVEDDRQEHPLESALKQIWMEVLGLERLSIYDDFFDIGGHSLKAVGLAARIRRELGVDINVADVLKWSTIKTMAEKLSRLNKNYSECRLNGKNTGNYGVDIEYLYTRSEYDKPELYIEHDLEIGQGDYATRGTLSIPKGPGPFAAVILVPGDGELDRDMSIFSLKPFKDLAAGLSSNNTAVLRYEKSVQGDFYTNKDYTIDEEFVVDVLASIEVLEKRRDIDSNNIFLLGHCRGGWMIPKILQDKRSTKVRGAILLSAPNPLRTEIQSYFETERMYLLSEEEMLEHREQLNILLNTRFDPSTPLKDFNLVPSAKWWHSLKDYIPAKLVSDQDQPLLIMQAGRDLNIPVSDLDKWGMALQERANVNYKLYEKLNHCFVEGYGNPTLEEYAVPGNVPEYVIMDIINWIQIQYLKAEIVGIRH